MIKFNYFILILLYSCVIKCLIISMNFNCYWWIYIDVSWIYGIKFSLFFFILLLNLYRCQVIYKIFFSFFTVRNILFSFWKWDKIEKYEISSINKIKSTSLWLNWKFWVVSSIEEVLSKFFKRIEFDYVIICSICIDA
jgi:hypothetical protein